MQSLMFGIVSFLASIAGAICGIGGGVTIKATLDLLGGQVYLPSAFYLAVPCYR